jgi:hypothetical protein
MGMVFMFKSCRGCNKKISLKENFIIWTKTSYKKGYICKDCKTKYMPTKLSRIANSFALWIIYMFLIMSPLRSKVGFIPYMTCFILASVIIPMIVVKYEVVENNA